MTDTLNGFAEVAKTTSQKNIIVWLNEYFGEVVGREGKPFEELVHLLDRGAATLGDAQAPTAVDDGMVRPLHPGH